MRGLVLRRRHWFRHMAAVPKGFLRWQVLELLSERPLSGAEIMDEVEKKTQGCWRPGPGSIYPLLSWLRDKGYIEEVREGEPGVKRYSITDNGRNLLEEQRKLMREFRGNKLMGMPFLCMLLSRVPPEEAGELREQVGRIFRAFAEMRMKLEENPSESGVREMINVLREVADRLEKANERLGGKRG